MNRSMKIRLVFLCCSFVIFSHCATFRSDLKHKFSEPGEKNYHANKVKVLFIFNHVRQTKGWDAIPKLENKYQRLRGFDDIFKDALNELSNLQNYATFTEFASDVNEPERRAVKDSLIRQHDFVVDIRIKKEKSFAKYFLGELVSTVSLTLFPIAYSKSYSVNVDVFNAQGHLIKNYQRQAGLTKWIQTFFIFLYPFHTERRKEEEIYVEFLHDIFRQIESEKILNSSL